MSTRKSLPDVETRKVEVIYPPSMLPAQRIPEIIRNLTIDKRPYHKRLFVWCAVGMPIVAPFGLVPVIPNVSSAVPLRFMGDSKTVADPVLLPRIPRLFAQKGNVGD